MKYDGARESAAHIRMKNIIAESLRCDPDFSEVQIEAIWKGTEANSRRKPDVRAIWRNSIPVAFEVQLSTTFLGVIAERRSFYCREGGLLLWVFKAFDMGDAKLTQDDIYYNNNRNAFAASEATLRASEASGHFTLDCIWSEPSMELGQLAWQQHQKLVSFRELTLDQAEQRAYFFDAQLAKDQCIAVSDDERLRSAFFAYWLRDDPIYDAEAWQSMWSSFGIRGIDFPRYPGASASFVALMGTLLSAREGRPIGWGHTNLIQVAHHVYDKHKGHLWAFKLMLAAHKQGERIRTQDASRNWRDRKVTTYLAAWAGGDPAFAPDRQFDDLICFLFPEIAADLPGNPH